MLKFFDALFPLGRTNMAFRHTPRNAEEALQIMDRYDVERSMVFHVVSRDSDVQQGNDALTGDGGKRLLPVWGYDPAYLIEESAEDFLRRAAGHGVRAVMVNPCMRNIRLEKSIRLGELAAAMEAMRMPLYLAYWSQEAADNMVDWYSLAEFCALYPNLPVIAWEWRARANRPLFDALALADNLHLIISSVWQAQSVDALCDTFGARRLLFSLGLPGLDPGSFQACVSYAAVSDSDKEAIAYTNMVHLLDGVTCGEVK